MIAKVLEGARAGRLNLATAVAAGPWIFLSGIRALMPHADALHGELPHRGRAKAELEAEAILTGLRDQLSNAGCAPRDVVRLDQYYTNWRAVPHYHVARRRAFAGAIPTSTSILEPSLLLPGSEIEVEAIARRPTEGERCERLTPSGLEVSPHMGFSPIVRTPELVFFAGQMAEEGNSGIADEAKVPATHLWKGSAIRLETEYLIRNKFEPAFAAVGIEPPEVVKAQVYLADQEDAPAFNDVWAQWFNGSPPATTIVPTARPGFNCPDASLEVNLIAVPRGAARRRVEPDGHFGLYESYPAAIVAGGLVFLSGLMAVDESGLTKDARVDPAVPYFSSSIEAQVEHIIAAADRICASAGARLDDAVRILQFHTDLNEFYPACQAWQRRLGDRPIPVTGLAVPGPLAAPAGTVMIDICVAT